MLTKIKPQYAVAAAILALAAAAGAVTISSLSEQTSPTSSYLMEVEDPGAASYKTTLGNAILKAHGLGDGFLSVSSGVLTSSDAATFRSLVGLAIGSDVQPYDADLAVAAGASAASNSTYFGKDASGTVGFHSLPSGGLAFTIDAPGASGAMLQSDGTKWARVTSLSGVTFGGFTAGRQIISDASGNLTAHSLAPDTIPSGSAPTVDAAGEIAVDTTSDQLVYYGSAKRVLTYRNQKDFVVKSPADSDDFLLFKAQSAVTITGIHCIAQGGTSISLTIQECGSTGGSCSDVDSAITCDGDGATDDGSLSNPAIDAGNWVKVVLGAPSGTVNFLSGSIYYVTTSD